MSKCNCPVYCCGDDDGTLDVEDAIFGEEECDTCCCHDDDAGGGCGSCACCDG